MEAQDNGYFTNIGTIWYTCCDDNSIRFLYMEAEQIHSTNSNDRVRPRLQEIGRYYYQTNRPTKVGSNGTKKT